MDGAEDEMQGSGPAAQLVQHPGELDDELPEQSNEIDPEVRACRVPAGTGHRDLDQVCGRGDRPDPEADTPDVQLRVAVQPEDG